jgi:hypothetical protein
MSDLCDLVNKVTGCAPDIKIEKIKKASFYRVEISLENARDNEKLSIAGEYLTVGKIHGYASCKIRLNHSNAPLLDLREVREFEGHFDDIFFTTDGYGHKCVLYIATSLNTKVHVSTPLKYDGGALTGALNTQNYVRRFTEEEYIMNEFNLRNTHAVNGFEIGVIPRETLPDIAYFRDYSWRIVAQETFKLSKINLRTLGFASTVDDASVNLKYMGSIFE